jgi:hypothetical protein
MHDDDRTGCPGQLRQTTPRVDLGGRLGHGYRVANGGAQAPLVGDVDVDHISPRRGDNVFRLWDGALEPRPVDLDQQHLTLDAERETSAVTDLAEAASQDLGGENPQPHVLDSKLSD